MIEKLIAALNDRTGELPAESIAEALWLAQYMARGTPGQAADGSLAQEDPTADATAGMPAKPRRRQQQNPRPDDGDADEPESEATAAAQMFAAEGDHSRDRGVSVLAAGGPALRALPHVLELEKALAQLRRAVETQRDPLLDEQGTAERSAETGHVAPVYLPSRDQWLDLVIVIDRSPSMAVWESTIAEFVNLTERHPAFGLVSVWQLRPDRSGRHPSLSAGGTEASRDPRELIDPTRLRLVLVISDCIERMWEGETLKRWLATWGRAGLVAIVQPLPQRLWHRCRPETYLVSLTSPAAGAAMARMRPLSRDGSVTIPHDAVAVPVLELTAPWLASGAALITARQSAVNAVVILTKDPPEVVDDAVSADDWADDESIGNPSGAEQVRWFRESASPNARNLAEFLAAAPLTLPVMRLVQQLMLPDSLPHDLAEVFLSGLIYRVTRDDGSVPAERVLYDFTKDVRQALLSGLRAGEALMILDEVSRYVNRRMGTSFDFPAFLAGQHTEMPTNEYVQPFATVARGVLTALGGRYAALAEQLNPTPSDETDARRYLDRNLAPGNGISHDQGDDVTQSTDDSLDGAVSGRPEVWGDVPPRNPDFTGREDLLDALRRQLTSQVTALLPHTLHGLGGVGKTQLAVEYAYRYESDYDLVWWVPAEQQVLLRQSLTALARRLDVVRPGDVDVSEAVASVYDALRTGRRYRRWLIVFDNANRPEDLAPFLSNPGGHVLVTSRNDNWDGVAKPLEVNVFERSESMQLLRRRLRDISDVDADRVAHLLGDLPLALEQAANWISATATPITEYIDLLEKRTVVALNEGTSTTYDAPVAVALGLSLDRLADENEPALHLLQLCAFFGPEPISIRLLPSGRYARNLPPILAETVRDDIELRRAVRDIGRFGLAKVEWPRNSLQVHRLVQAVLRDRLTAEERLTYRTSVQEILEAYNPGDPTDDPTFWPRQSEIGPHIAASGALTSDNPAIRTVVLDQIRYLYVTGDYASSRELAEAAYRLWREKLGDEHRLTIVTARFLANAMRSTGDAEATRRLNERTLEISRRALGEDHEHTLALANSVGGDLRLAGEWDQSKALDEELLARHRRVFGDDDPNTLRVANNLGVDLRLLGDFEKAYELDQDTWTRRRRLLGDDHPDALFSVVSGVSRDLYGLGRYQDAIDLQRRWLPVLRNRLGLDHANVLLASRIHAASLRKAGLTQEACELSREVVYRREKRYGKDHPETISAMLTLFSVLARIDDRVAEAKGLAERTLTAYRRSVGNEHVFTYVCMTDYAIVLRRAGDYAPARELDEAALRGMRNTRTLGPRHPYTICAAVNMSNNMAMSRNHHAAVDLLSDTLPLAHAALGEDHPEALACAANLSLDLRAIGRGDEARALREDTIRRFRRVLRTDDHPDIVDMLHERRLYCVVDPPPI